MCIDDQCGSIIVILLMNVLCVLLMTLENWLPMKNYYSKY